MTYMSLVKSKLHDISKHHDGFSVLSLNLLLQVAQHTKKSVYNSEQEKLCIEALKTLMMSNTAYALLNYLSQEDISFKFCDLGDFASAYDHETKTICLNEKILEFTNKPAQEALVLYYISHQIRRAWQANENFGAYIATSYGEFVQKFRDEEADTTAVQIQIAYELKNLGHSALWYLILDSFALELALEYSEIRDLDLSLKAEKKALKLIYAKWFEDYDYLSECDDRALIAQGLEGDEHLQKLRVF